MAAHFYNTVHLSGEALELAIQKAVTQEDRVMALFDATPGNAYTPCEVHHLIKSRGPLTSTRRAMCDLTKQGRLIKTNEQRLGMYDVLNFAWALPGYGHEPYTG